MQEIHQTSRSARNDDILYIGDLRYFKANVAFHFRRKNVYDAWECVGVYSTSPFECSVRYKYSDLPIKRAFDAEVKSVDSIYITGSADFLNIWRKRYSSMHDVICPIINYYSRFRKMHRITSDLYTRYVGKRDQKAFLQLALMLKMKDGYIPALLNSFDDDQEPYIIEAMKENGWL